MVYHLFLFILGLSILAVLWNIRVFFASHVEVSLPRKRSRILAERHRQKDFLKWDEKYISAPVLPRMVNTVSVHALTCRKVGSSGNLRLPKVLSYTDIIIAPTDSCTYLEHLQKHEMIITTATFFLEHCHVTS